MSTLRLRIDQYIDDLRDPPEVYATIYAVDETGARKNTRQELIPVSNRPETVKTIEVAAGHYYVETVLPSGEFLSDDFSIKLGETRDIVLRPTESPHEWLSWQQFAGNVQTPEPSVKRGPELEALRGATVVDGRFRRSRPRRTTEKTLHLPVSKEPEVENTVRWLTTTNITGPMSWRLLAERNSTNPRKLIAELNSGNSPKQLPASVFDSQHAVYRILIGHDAAGADDPGREPVYLAVERRSSIELLRLPVPWFMVRDGHWAEIEVAVQDPQEPTSFCSSVIVRDNAFGVLVGYLSSGSLPAVRQLAETAKELLYYKIENPFAAVAGAYSLIGTAQQTADESWHEWVSNLMHKFPHVPDGAIQWGQLKMRMRRNSADVAEAQEAFMQAYARGIPFYSLGVRWLLEGLEWVAQDVPAAKDAADEVRAIAYRVNYRQPFTILRVGGATDV